MTQRCFLKCDSYATVATSEKEYIKQRIGNEMDEVHLTLGEETQISYTLS